MTMVFPSPQSLLEACLVRGLWLSRTRRVSTSEGAESSLEAEFPITDQQPGQPHPLLQVEAHLSSHYNQELTYVPHYNDAGVHLCSPL